jgi:hypothetical protein
MFNLSLLVQIAGVPIAKAIQNAALAYFNGWVVDFSTDDDLVISSLGLQKLSVPPEVLVFGVAALPGDLDGNLPAIIPPFKKIFTMDPKGNNGSAFLDAMHAMESAGGAPRGFMFWCGEDEAKSSSPFYMSRGLSDVLTRAGLSLDRFSDGSSIRMNKSIT